MTPNASSIERYLMQTPVALGSELLQQVQPPDLPTLGDALRELTQLGRLAADSPVLSVTPRLLEVQFTLRN